MASAPGYPGQGYPQSSGNSSTGIVPAKVEIHVSCENLANKDVLSKSDPMVILFTEQRSDKGKHWKEYGRTEIVKDNLNPRFTKCFNMEYHFEQQQNLKFEVYDSDSTSSKLEQHDFLGQVIISLGNIVGEYCGKVTKQLLNRDNRTKTNSKINFIAEEMNDTKEAVVLQLSGSKLDKKDFFGKSDPFLIIYRHAIENNDYMPVHKTEVIKNTLNPIWKSFELSVTSLCNNDKLRPIKIECYDWDADGTHDFIGACTVSLDELLSKKGFPKDLVNPKKLKKKNYKNSGVLDIGHIELKPIVSFLDYITGGIELCFYVAIDFTASNGNPMDPRSLHYQRRDGPNQYAQALLTVGKICEDYDSDKLMPAFGFGAKIRGVTYHDFHLNQTENPDCYGVIGILEAYQRFLATAELYGPTNFSPVINMVTKLAQPQGAVKKYHILLILTDGVITDMDNTKSAIINASRFPMSIIIVGIGNAEFDAMDELDCDEGTLTYNGRRAEQDIVQFVPFRKYSGQYASEDLAKEVLYEIPNQLVTYMKKHGIKPQPRPQYPTQGGPQGPQYPTQGGPQGPQYPTQGGPQGPQYPTQGAPQGPQYPTQGAPQGPQYPTQAGPPQYPTQGGPQAPQYHTQGGPGASQYPTQGGPGASPYPTQGGPGAPQYPTQGGPGAPQYPTQGGPGVPQYPTQGGPGAPQYPTQGGPGAPQYPAQGGV